MSDVDLSVYESSTPGWYEYPGVEKKMRKAELLAHLDGDEFETDEVDETQDDTTSVSLPVLRIGTRGEMVEKAQALLNATRRTTLTVDGVFGKRMQRALYEYQETFLLPADGTVNAKTWRHLLAQSD